jgi:hypothetical protein
LSELGAGPKKPQATFGVPPEYLNTWRRCMRRFIKYKKNLRTVARVCLTGPPGFCEWVCEGGNGEQLAQEIEGLRVGRNEEGTLF